MKTQLAGTVLCRLVWVALGALVWEQTCTVLSAETKPTAAEQSKTDKTDKPGKAPPLKITIDTSKAPEMAKWAAHVKSLCDKAYPMIWAQLGAPGFQPPSAIKIVFEDKDGVAWTAGTQITCCSGWFKEHPDDYGAVIHELSHVVQSYHRRVPGWVTEGIADYVRWFKFEPANRRPHVDPRHAKYTDSYQTTAAFFDWIVRTQDRSFVRRLNAAARAGKYNDDLFRRYTRKPLDELWAQFIDSLKKS
jgi:hypothetical protein